MGSFLDILLLIVIAITIFYTYKIGFIKIAVTVVGVIFIVFFGISLADSMAEYTYEEFIEPKIIASAEDVAIDGTKETLDNVWNALPKMITKRADLIDFSKENLDELITDNYKSDAKKTFEKISEDLIKPGTLKVLGVVFAVIIMAALWSVLGIVSNLLNSLFKFKKLETVNSALAILIGVFVGLLMGLIYCVMLKYIVKIFPDGFFFITKENIENTDFCKWVISKF